MTREEINKIIAKWGQAWVDRNPDAVMALIARDNLQYFETNFDPPTTDWGGVKKLWDIVPENQTDVTWWHEIVLIENNKTLAHAKVTRTMLPSNEKQNIDAAFLFGFDGNGQINYFRQWRSVTSL
ncbi:nuclear transport factor 2 family protein [Candidatus Saccharibacteria bacterium]|nr:nuclear transport factor 2 family protein [Candidatus Saccharibacteria bacterium]